LPVAISGVRRAAPPFDLQHVVSEGRHTLVLTGELDMRTTPEVEEVMVACAASARQLTLDLSRLTFMDSTGLGLVLSAQQLCQASGAEFALVPGTPQVQSVFEVTGLLDRLPFQTT
jgi:anti-sigma B factor antagonist